LWSFQESESTTEAQGHREKQVMVSPWLCGSVVGVIA